MKIVWNSKKKKSGEVKKYEDSFNRVESFSIDNK